MFSRLFHRMQMPPAPIIIIHPPDALLVADERKRDSPGCLVEVYAQELLCGSLHNCATARNGAFGLQRDALKKPCAGQSKQELINKPLYIHLARNVS